MDTTVRAYIRSFQKSTTKNLNMVMKRTGVMTVMEPLHNDIRTEPFKVRLNEYNQDDKERDNCAHQKLNTMS